MFSNRLSVIARGLRCVLGGLAFAPLTLHRIGRVPSLGEERIMPDWKRIRQAVWHPTVAHLREAQDEDGYHPCSCAPASAGGNSCSTLECVNRGCQMECVPSLCPCGEECTNQEIQRQALPNVEYATRALQTESLLRNLLIIGSLLRNVLLACELRPAAVQVGVPKCRWREL